MGKVEMFQTKMDLERGERSHHIEERRKKTHVSGAKGGGG